MTPGDLYVFTSNVFADGQSISISFGDASTLLTGGADRVEIPMKTGDLVVYLYDECTEVHEQDVHVLLVKNRLVFVSASWFKVHTERAQ